MFIQATTKEVKKSLTVREQQLIASELLEVCKKHMGRPILSGRWSGDDALVAGGAPRDWFRDKLCNDIDIFYWEDKQFEHNIPACVAKDLTKASKKEGRVALSKKEIEIDTEVGDDGDVQQELDFDREAFKKIEPKTKKEYMFHALKAVHEGTYKGLKFQLIGIDPYWCKPNNLFSMKDVVNYIFDINICKCFYDGNKVTLSKEAKKDFKDKTLTVSISQLKKNKRVETLPKRTAKLQSYFPDHRLIVNI